MLIFFLFSEIGRLQSLESLNVSSNGLRAIPPSISELQVCAHVYKLIVYVCEVIYIAFALLAVR